MNIEAQCKAVTATIQEARGFVATASDSSLPLSQRALAVQDALAAAARGITKVRSLAYAGTAHGNMDALAAAGFQADKIQTLAQLALRACNQASLMVPVTV
jgi:hypothetical protein